MFKPAAVLEAEVTSDDPSDYRGDVEGPEDWHYPKSTPTLDKSDYLKFIRFQEHVKLS